MKKKFSILSLHFYSFLMLFHRFAGVPYVPVIFFVCLSIFITADSFQPHSQSPKASSVRCSATDSPSLSSNYDNVILYDGVCNFCNAWVDILLQIDTKKRFRFAALQSDTGKKCLEGVGKERDDISSVMLIKSRGGGSLEGYEKVRGSKQTRQTQHCTNIEKH